VAAIGNLGGFAGPAFTGIAEDSTGGFEMPLTVLSLLLVMAATLALLLRERPAAVLEPAPEPG
jgi:MFS transporter, ACS family, tartrate transporter